MPFDVSVAIPMFITWVIVSAIALYIIWKDIKSVKIKIALYVISIVLAGFVIGGIPSAVMPIQQVLIVLGSGNAMISAILPLIIIMVLLLLTTIFLGRLFCGFACPVGAIQELLSRIKFKSNLKEQKSINFRIETSSKLAWIIRWIFFGVVVVFSLAWSVALLQVLNPFLGFSVFRNAFAVTILLPIITLIIVSIASIFIYRPWCRYLCPFGALAGETSKLSLMKIQRTDDCTDCGLCEKICPTQEASKSSKKGECYLCGRCIEICPQNALKFRK